MIEYRGYPGIFEFDPEIDAFHGAVLNTNDVISLFQRDLPRHATMDIQRCA